MPQPKYRIPRRVDLGHGYIVRTILVPPLRLIELFTEYSDSEPEPGDTMSGFIDDDDDTNWIMYINSRIPVSEKWDTFYHELLHAVTDIKDLVRGG